MKETSFIVLLLLSSTFGSVIFKRSLEELPKFDIDIQSLYYINNLQCNKIKTIYILFKT